MSPHCCAEQGQDGLSQVEGVDQELHEMEWRVMKQLCSVHTQVLASLTLLSPKQQLLRCFCSSAI